MPNTKSTAVLIFANSAGLDEVRKGIPKSKTLFAQLNNEIIAKVEKTGLPYFLYSEDLQIGSSFSARFTTAIQTIFSKGFDHIITVGNDTPNLTVASLLQCYENLIQGKTVIGPSTDGGIYILGIHKNRFDASSFKKLPWQKQNLFQETARFFLRRGMLHQLPRLTDIDNLDDIEVVINQRATISLTLLRILLGIARKKISAKNALSSGHSFPGFEQPFNKGSPFSSLQQ